MKCLTNYDYLYIYLHVFRLFVILFTIAVVFNGPGVHMAFLSTRNAIRAQIKNEIRQGIPESELHCIRDNPQLHWREKNREFKMGNRMYDVVKVKRINGQLIYCCINDTQEEKLFADVNELVDQELEDQGRLADDALLGNFMSFFSTGKPYYTQLPEFTYAQKSIATPYHFSIRKIHLDVPHLPPNPVA